MATGFTLIVAILTVESSYLQDIERPTVTTPDTVQFWFAPEGQWRIKTYSIDHDIHTHRIGVADDKGRITTEFARNNIRKSYGDVISRIIVVEFSDPTDQDEVQRILSRHKLTGTLEPVKDGYFFYNPDRGEYRSKSKPR